MTFEDAQKDMNTSYCGGGTGVLASGVIWCLAGIVALQYSYQSSMLALFFGGMFIHPIAIFLSKALKRSGKHNANNPLGKLALESTIILFVGLFIAFAVATLKPEWFYPIMLMIIGVRYLIFNTLYGTKVYWILGALLMISGALCIFFASHFVIGAFIGAALEIVFAVVILNQSKNLHLKTT
ncbi:DUF7010 family protein [Pseudoalteromonas lipolytica]|jgi:hypothetical protein|uniref:DUF7010 family protein n=1 Tax=Pseudoalteromonas lipolytica TaxID=570156 RepID=UPI000C443CE8|nr:hypothetical protein [Pseudoalteromonas lipolytica]MAE01441.1 hypothetical protein [Pseudoalteromonas sp.]|tara:strand:+ start:2349 stop:2894 length:546 start_codon:yes stop_codon:yes gene_type:complete